MAAILIGLAAGRDRKVSVAEPETRGAAAQPLTSLQPANPASGS